MLHTSSSSTNSLDITDDASNSTSYLEEHFLQNNSDHELLNDSELLNDPELLAALYLNSTVV